ncbi:MAG: galactose oxidase-like domain-containing protein [Pseudomonadota bacterium]
MNTFKGFFSRFSALTSITLLVSSMGAQAQQANEASLSSGAIAIAGNTLHAARHGSTTSGAELFTKKSTQNWQRHSLALSTKNHLHSIEMVVTPQGKTHLVGVENGSIIHFSTGNNFATNFGKRQSFVGPKVKNAVGLAFSKASHLEIAAPLVNGGLGFWYAKADGTGVVHYGKALTGRNIADIALVQATYNTTRLEAVIRQGSQLIHITRGNNLQWQIGKTIANNANGEVALVQKGNKLHLVFESNNGLVYWTFNNGQWTFSRNFTGQNYYSVGLSYSKSQSRFFMMALKPNGTFDAWDWADNNTAPKKQNVKVNPFATNVGGNATLAGKGLGIVGIHTTLLPNGELLAVGYSDNNAQTGVARIYNTQQGARFTKNLNEINLFCSGHALMPNGNVLFAGGHSGPKSQLKYANIYNTSNNSWQAVDQLNFGRWYPTVTTLADGRMMIISGSEFVGKGGNMNNTLQFYNPKNFSLSNAFNLPKPFTKSYNYSNTQSIAMYPFVYQLPDGTVAVHSGDTTRFYNPNNNNWLNKQYTNKVKISRNYPVQVPSVLLPLSPANGYKPKLMVFGAAGNNWEDGIKSTTPAKTVVELLDLGKQNPAWQQVAPLKSPRILGKAVLLPTGEVMVVGGSSAGYADNVKSPLASVEVYNPNNNSWKQWNPISVPRLYHSTATLMPDGSIILMGTDKLFNLEPFKAAQHRVEVYKPPYFYKGERPIIQSIQTTNFNYQKTYSIQLANNKTVKKVVMIHTGSSTHAFDMSQRMVELNFTTNGKTIFATSPRDSKVAPPGHYMVFVIDANNRPSVAKMVRIGPNL